MTATVASSGSARTAASAASRTRPVGTALAALLAPWGFVVANTCYTLATRDGGSDATGAETLALFATHPTLVRVGSVAVMIGALLLIPALVGILASAGRARLAAVGGWLMIGGYVGYLAVVSTNGLQLAMAQSGPGDAYAAVIDRAQADPAFTWVFALFVLGNLVGTLLFGAGLLRTRRFPAWALVLILCWPPLHVVNLVVGNEAYAVAGAALQAVGFAALALRLLRRP